MFTDTLHDIDQLSGVSDCNRIADVIPAMGTRRDGNQVKATAYPFPVQVTLLFLLSFILL